jgi:replicative DNA helicase
MQAMAAVECEQAVLGSVFVRNERYWACAEAGLMAEHFSTATHQKLWAAVEGHVKAGLPANPFTLAQRFANDVEFVEGPAYLVHLSTFVVGLAGGAESYARVVMEWAARRKLLELSSALGSDACDGAVELRTAIERVETGVASLRETGNTRGPQTMAQAVQAALESAERAHKRGRVEGVESGLKAIDNILGGLADTDLIVLAGRPGMGKSALAGTIAQNVAKQSCVALFSLEMAAEQFASRMVAGAAAIDAARLRKGEISGAELERAVQSGRGMEGLHLVIDDQAQLRPLDIRARLKRIAQKMPVGLIVVDYIQLMRADTQRRDASRVLEIAEITGALKAMAKEFACPVLALSQLSRAVEARDDKRPLLSDLRDSGAIEQDADQVWFLYRDEYYARREEPNSSAGAERYAKWQQRMQASAGVAELIVAKNRHGPDAILKLSFQARYARFAD